MTPVGRYRRLARWIALVLLVGAFGPAGAVLGIGVDAEAPAGASTRDYDQVASATQHSRSAGTTPQRTHAPPRSSGDRTSNRCPGRQRPRSCLDVPQR